MSEEELAEFRVQLFEKIRAGETNAEILDWMDAYTAGMDDVLGVMRLLIKASSILGKLVKG
jgi:hypothetical protein